MIPKAVFQADQEPGQAEDQVEESGLETDLKIFLLTGVKPVLLVKRLEAAALVPMRL